MVPSVLILPKDIQDEDYEEPAVAHGFTRSGVGYSKPKIVPEEADLAKAADILNAGNKVAILIGAGARGTAPQLTEMATLLGAGVAKALLGKDVLPDDLPFVTGAIGLLGTEPSWDLMQGCDTLLMVGTGFPWSEFLPKDGAARAVQIDIDASMLSLRYPVRSQPSRRRRRDAEGAAPPDQAQGRPRLVEEDRSQRRSMVEEARRTRQGGRRSGEPAARRLGNVAACCRRTPSSPATADPAPTGLPATTGCSRGNPHRSRAAWPRWVRPSPTPSAPSSPIPTGR